MCAVNVPKWVHNVQDYETSYTCSPVSWDQIVPPVSDDHLQSCQKGNHCTVYQLLLFTVQYMYIYIQIVKQDIFILSNT